MWYSFLFDSIKREKYKIQKGPTSCFRAYEAGASATRVET
jgi:hypothetical protein